MANPNFRKRLENISDELLTLEEHAVQYSGIAEKDARFIHSVADDIIASAQTLKRLARAKLR
jgi:hypothetical protein